MNDALERGLSAYAAGDFFAAHEHLEALWLEAGDPRLRSGRQGLVLVAVAMHKLFTQHKPAVAVRLLRRAIDRLDHGPVEVDGIDTAALIATLAATAAAIDRGEAVSAPPLGRAASR